MWPRLWSKAGREERAGSCEEGEQPAPKAGKKGSWTSAGSWPWLAGLGMADPRLGPGLGATGAAATLRGSVFPVLVSMDSRVACPCARVPS